MAGRGQAPTSLTPWEKVVPFATSKDVNAPVHRPPTRRVSKPVLPRTLQERLPAALRLRWSGFALVFFIAYMCAMLAYLVIRIIDITASKDKGQQGYSIALLFVEVVGISALVPYALANVRAILPIKEDTAAADWAEFGCTHEYDVFVLVPCYKESWKTLKRTLMSAALARLPPGCRKHIIVGNDGHGVDNDNCRERSLRLQQLSTDLRTTYGAEGGEWQFKVHESRRPKVRCDKEGRPLSGDSKKITGNAKSLNLNHCIKEVIPNILAQYYRTRQAAASPSPTTTNNNNTSSFKAPRLEDFDAHVLKKCVIVVLDCDMAIHNDPNEFKTLRNTPPRNNDHMGFFPKILRILEDPRYDLVLTPQYFTNILPEADAFNHLNPQFWDYILPGLTALGYVACTGTNMGLRLSMLHDHRPSDRPTTTTSSSSSGKALKTFATDQGPGSALYEAAMQGPFPTYSVTEDYALSLELRKAGYKGTYHAEYLVRGEAPHGIQAVDIQRGRWTEGHWQIYFSRRNPVFYPHKLGFICTILYNYGTWAYFCNVLTIWVYQAVPLLSAVGIQPVAFTEKFRWAATFYLLLTYAVQYYVREAPHFFGMWRANISNVLLSWTYLKAIGRAVIRKKSGFATHTAEEEAEADPIQDQPPMEEPQPENLVQAGLKPIWDHLVYFSLLLALSLATILVCIVKGAQHGRTESRFVLPAAWAIYNAVGPALFLCAALLKKTKSLGLAMHLFCMVHGMMGLTALVAMWFVNSQLTLDFSGAPAP